jgi:hypothetical protein
VFIVAEKGAGVHSCHFLRLLPLYISQARLMSMAL